MRSITMQWSHLAVALVAAALFGAGATACIGTITKSAEALAASTETALDEPAARPGHWSDDSKAALQALCLSVNKNKFRADVQCACLVAESEKRIDEQAFREWFLSGGELRADEVVPRGTEAEQVCRDRLNSI